MEPSLRFRIAGRESESRIKGMKGRLSDKGVHVDQIDVIKTDRDC